jgi:hypothetical protein
MKFHSLIAPLNHGIRIPASAVLGLVCLSGTTSCVSLMAKKHTYAASSSAVRVNGAQVRMQVKPEGTDGGSYAMSAMVVSAVVATMDGPFRWRIEATGEVGKQESLVIHRIRTRTTKTKRDEWYPKSHLGKRADFKVAKGEAGPARATYEIPGLLVVKPREDGVMEIFVDLTVTTLGKRERKLVLFRMDPSQTRQDEFIFLPTEIVKGFGKSPADWNEAGWD